MEDNLKKENVKLQIPINIDIQLTDNDIIRAMMKSKIFFKDIKPALDLGRFILENIKNRDEFLRWFYKNKYLIKLEDLKKWLR